MLNRSQYHRRRTPLAHFADQVSTLELLWPFPLLGIGIFKIDEPVLIVLALGLAGLPWLVRWLASGRPTHQVFIGGALALLAISAPVGVWASYDLALSWPLLLTLLGSISLFFAIANTSVLPRRIAGGLVVTAALFAFYFVGQYGYFDYPDEVGRLANLARFTGSVLPQFVFFTPHPNAAAGFLESTLLLSLVLAWQARGGKRAAWGVAAALIAYGLLISGSRGAWLGLVVAFGLGGLLLIRNRTLRWVIAGIGLAGVIFAAYLLIQMALGGSSLPGLSSTLETAQSRLRLYRNSLYLLGDYPFTGIGLGDTFAMVYSRYQLLIQVPFLTYSHNLLLSVGLGLGLPGLAALLWLLISFYIYVFRIERIGISKHDWLLFCPAWLGATVTFLHGLTDAPQFVGSGWTMPMLFAVLGLAVVLGRPAFDEDEDEPGEYSRNLYRLWRGGVITAVILIVVGMTIFWRPLRAAWYANLGSIQQTWAELSPDLDDATREAATRAAVDDFARALNVRPVQPVANRRLGLMALDRQNFETAVLYLEQAYGQEPGNQATLKALGLAYVWTGQLDRAESLLRQRDDLGEVIEELGNWSSWWAGQGRSELAASASEMAQRLSAEP